MTMTLFGGMIATVIAIVGPNNAPLTNTVKLVPEGPVPTVQTMQSSSSQPKKPFVVHKEIQKVPMTSAPIPIHYYDDWQLKYEVGVVGIMVIQTLLIAWYAYETRVMSQAAARQLRMLVEREGPLLRMNYLNTYGGDKVVFELRDLREKTQFSDHRATERFSLSASAIVPSNPSSIAVTFQRKPNTKEITYGFRYLILQSGNISEMCFKINLENNTATESDVEWKKLPKSNQEAGRL